MPISLVPVDAHPKLTEEADRLFDEVYAGEGLTPREVVESAFKVRRIHESGGKIIVAWDPIIQCIKGAVVFADFNCSFRHIATQGEAEFRLLAVRRDSRREGIGRLLIEECTRIASQAGADRLVLSTQELKMRAAQALYESMGFVRVPARDWNSSQGVRFLVYQLTLR